MNDDELHSLIRLTHPKPSFPASFNRDTWARIALAEESSWQGRLRRGLERFFASLARPASAAALVMTMLLIGAGLGNLTTAGSPDDALRNAYVNSINPLTAAHAVTPE